jgi:hypothetical protein
MKVIKGQHVRITEGTIPEHRQHPNDPDLEGLVGTVTGRTLNGMIEVDLPYPGTGKIFGFLMNPDEVEEL